VRSESIGLLVVGQPSRRGVFGRVSPGIVTRLVDQLKGFDILVVEEDNSGHFR
jgi:K+-sensing histidine kinase KdpD